MAFFVARPAAAYLATINPHRQRAVVAVVFADHGGPSGLVVSAFLLQRLLARASLRPVAPDVCRLAVALHARSKLLSTVFGGLMLWGLYAVIWTIGGWWWLVAAGLFFVVSVVAGQLVPVIDHAAVLQNPADRKSRIARPHGPAGRRHRPVDLRRLSLRPERRHGQSQRHAGRTGPHAPAC